jgi:hypothetical protein
MALQYALNPGNTSYAVITGSCTDGAVAIPSTYNGLPVTAIGPSGFFNCTTITSITIPDSVTGIGQSAFFNCTNLNRVSMGSGLKTIGGSAFAYCNGLTGTITMPNTVTSLGPFVQPGFTASTFYSCQNITNIVLSNTLTSIPSFAFYNCNKLTGVTIPDSVTGIGDSAFSLCTNVKSLNLGNGLTSIGYAAFSFLYNMTGTLIIPNSVTTIGSAAFSNCTGITNMVLSNSLTGIPNFMIGNCSSLKSLTIPNSVTGIDVSPFQGCISLTGIIVDTSNPSYSSDIYGVLYNKNKSSLNVYPIGRSGSFVIPNSVDSLNDGSFFQCSNLTSVIIPDSVTYIGGLVFSFCTSLENFIMGNGVTTIRDQTFRGCSKLTNINIGNNVNAINAYAFSACELLTSVNIPNSVTFIGEGTFSTCPNLIRINFLGNSPTIGGVFPFDAGNPDLKIYRKKNFVTGWASTFGGVPVVLISENLVKSGGSGKLTTKDRYLYIVAGAQVPSDMNVRFYDSKQRTVSTQQPIYYDENNQYQLRYVGDGWKIFSITVSDVYGAFYRSDGNYNPVGGGYDGRNGWIGTVTISNI